MCAAHSIASYATIATFRYVCSTHFWTSQ